MKNQENLKRIELVEEAMALVEEAINGTSKQSHYEDYGKYGFDQLLGNGNPYDSGLPDLIDMFNDEDEDEKTELF